MWSLFLGCGCGSTAQGSEPVVPVPEKLAGTKQGVPTEGVGHSAEVGSSGSVSKEAELAQEAIEMSLKYGEERGRFDSNHEQTLAAHSSSTLCNNAEEHDQLLRAAQEQHDSLLSALLDKTDKTAEEISRSLYYSCDADQDGNVDAVELLPLVEMLFDHRPDVAANMSHNLMKMVTHTMQQIEAEGIDINHDARLNFVEFVHLLCCSPWISLVPTEKHSELKELCSRLEQEARRPAGVADHESPASGVAGGAGSQ